MVNDADKVAAEIAALRAMLSTQTALYEGLELLKPDDFDEYRYVFETILRVFQEGEEVSATAVTARLRAVGRTSSPGDFLTPAPVTDGGGGSVEDALNSTRSLYHMSCRRRLLQACQLMKERAADPAVDAGEAWDAMEAELAAVRPRAGFHGSSPVKHRLYPWSERLEWLQDRTKDSVREPQHVLAMVRECVPGSLSLITGPDPLPQLLARDVALHRSVDDGLAVLLASLGRSADELTHEAIAWIADMLPERVWSRPWSNEDYHRIADAAGRANAAPLHMLGHCKGFAHLRGAALAGTKTGTFNTIVLDELRTPVAAESTPGAILHAQLRRLVESTGAHVIVAAAASDPATGTWRGRTPEWALPEVWASAERVIAITEARPLPTAPPIWRVAVKERNSTVRHVAELVPSRGGRLVAYSGGIRPLVPERAVH